MPIYEFRCKECENEFEDIFSVNSPIPNCPECGGTTERLVSRFSGVVKGSEHSLLDCVVGADAEKRRSFLQKRKEKREKIQREQKKGE